MRRIGRREVLYFPSRYSANSWADKYDIEACNIFPLLVFARLAELDKNEDAGDCRCRALIGPLMWVSTQIRPHTN